MGKHAGSIDNLVFRRIRKMAPGSVFSPRDLASLGPRTAVASALSRYVRSGMLSRPARGLYQVPEKDPLLGQLRPSPDAIARAVGGRDRLKLQPAGAYAANLLGLSDQVPLTIVYLTDGSPRQLQLGRQRIVLRRTTPRSLATAGRISGLVIQALRHLGRNHVDASTVSHLRRKLSPKDRAQLRRDAHLAPAWIAAVLHEIAGEGRR